MCMDFCKIVRDASSAWKKWGTASPRVSAPLHTCCEQNRTDALFIIIIIIYYQAQMTLQLLDAAVQSVGGLRCLLAYVDTGQYQPAPRRASAGRIAI